MIYNLIFGLPGERPGGLVLSLLVALASGSAALLLGFIYAGVSVMAPRLSIGFQAAAAFFRGVPLLLLVFFIAQASTFSLPVAGMLALLVYSLVHVGEILRSFLAAYPPALGAQARVMGLGRARDWLRLRAPWTFRKALPALATHWISLLKDTGALVVLGIGELTTVAKILSESSGAGNVWLTTLLAAGSLYLGATLCLIGGLNLLARRLPVAT